MAAFFFATRRYCAHSGSNGITVSHLHAVVPYGRSHRIMSMLASANPAITSRQSPRYRVASPIVSTLISASRAPCHAHQRAMHSLSPAPHKIQILRPRHSAHACPAQQAHGLLVPLVLPPADPAVVRPHAPAHRRSVSGDLRHDVLDLHRLQVHFQRLEAHVPRWHVAAMLDQGRDHVLGFVPDILTIPVQCEFLAPMLQPTPDVLGHRVNLHVAPQSKNRFRTISSNTKNASSRNSASDIPRVKVPISTPAYL